MRDEGRGKGGAGEYAARPSSTYASRLQPAEIEAIQTNAVPAPP